MVKKWEVLIFNFGVAFLLSISGDWTGFRIGAVSALIVGGLCFQMWPRSDILRLLFFGLPPRVKRRIIIARVVDGVVVERYRDCR